MLFGLTILPEHVAIVVLAAIVAAAVVAYFLRKDSAIDERQKMCSKAASVLSKWELPRLASIMHCAAAIDMDSLIAEIRSLVDDVGGEDGEEKMLVLLRKNYFYSLPKRLKNAQDRAEMLVEIAKNDEFVAELFKFLEVEEAEAAT